MVTGGQLGPVWAGHWAGFWVGNSQFGPQVIAPHTVPIAGPQVLMPPQAVAPPHVIKGPQIVFCAMPPQSVAPPQVIGPQV